MSKAKHFKYEKLDGLYHAIKEDDFVMLRWQSGFHGITRFVKRIISCLNACEGIEDPTGLRASGLWVEEDSVDEILAQKVRALYSQGITIGQFYKALKNQYKEDPEIASAPIDGSKISNHGLTTKRLSDDCKEEEVVLPIREMVKNKKRNHVHLNCLEEFIFNFEPSESNPWISSQIFRIQLKSLIAEVRRGK